MKARAFAPWIPGRAPQDQLDEPLTSPTLTQRGFAAQKRNRTKNQVELEPERIGARPG